jgi:GNAT superfamily N-acetyltransferase
VEPTERTEELYTTIASDISSRVDHGAMSESLCITAVTAGDEDDQPESFVEGSIMEGYEDEAAKYERLAKAAKAATLLARRTSSRPSGQVTGRSTSVGARRIGSASQALTGTRSFDLLTDAVKKVAAASTTKPNKEKTDKQGPSLSRSLSDIQATVESMMQTSMGLFGEAEVGPPPASFFNRQQFPPPGTVLVYAERSSKMWKAAERVSVRVASTADDLDIATLRLSVFSDFSADMRRAFCAKSCQVLATRRNRGATCVVATVPRYGSVMLPRPDIILGTAECSFHEFEGTTIGRRRLVDSILYITEVAVSPTARRKGIGQKLLEVSGKATFYYPV